MACSDRGSVIVGMTPVSEAKYASDKWTVRSYSQEVVVINPFIVLIFVAADDAKIPRGEIFQTAFGVKQPIVMKGDAPYIAEDADLLRRVIIHIAADGRGKLADRSFRFSAVAA